jgi:hypothetical protein
MFSDNLPMSNGHLYGYSLGTSEGKQIVDIQKAFSTNYVKKKSKDLIAYD